MADPMRGAEAEANAPPQRRFLFLQGLPGPFFRSLGRALAAQGAAVHRVNFNGGDWLDWHGRHTMTYRGAPSDWPRWLRAQIIHHGITDMVVFGDCRGQHRAARTIADEAGMRFWAFEEGYLRPDHITLERGGVNGQSSSPRSLRAVILLVERLPPPPPAEPADSRFRERAGQSVRHHTAAVFARRLFPHYASHRMLPAAHEAIGWTRRWLRRTIEREQSEQALAQLGDRPFFLHPLQIEGDSQIRFHSPFGSMVEAMQRIVASFAHAPREALLLIKMHPLDPGLLPWRRLVADAATIAGVTERVLFVERADLAPLLAQTRGVVTVNSTVGPLALVEHVPVLALGEAIYRMPGVTAEQELDAFWQAPLPVDAANVDLLCRALRAKCLVNGGFHSREGLDLLVRHSVERMMPA